MLYALPSSTSSSRDTYDDVPSPPTRSPLSYLAENYLVDFGSTRIDCNQIETIEEKFARLAEKWDNETINYSSLDKIVDHPAYKEIIGMGEVVLPVLFADLRKQPRHWFIALSRITDAQNVIPRSAAGNLEKMTLAWLSWGRRNGYF